jgi:hypothetical protein
MMNEPIIDFFDVISYLDHKGISHTTTGEHSTPGWINIDCVFCGGDQSQHLGINLENNACNCWRCGGHSVGKLIQMLEDCSWQEALVIMEKYQSYNRPTAKIQDYTPPQQMTMPKEFIKLSIHPSENLRPAYRFLYSRGINFNDHIIALDYEIYYSPGPLGDYKFRLGIPIYIRKQLVSFVTRDVTGKATKSYLACPDNKSVTPWKNTLYPYDNITFNNAIVLVEGPFDVWKLGQKSLCTFGTGWTFSQVALLHSLFPKKVFILFDSEEIAQESAKKLSKAIWFCDCEVVYLDDKKDPGELTCKEGKQLMKELVGK